MWISHKHWESQQQYIARLEQSVDKLMEENKKLVDRLLIKNEVSPIMDNREPKPLMKEVAGLDDFFGEISEEEYAKLDLAEKAKRESA